MTEKKINYTLPSHRAHVLKVSNKIYVAYDSAENNQLKVYVKEFGYITIPSMSLTVAVYLLTLAWVKKIYDKNRNA